MRPSDPRYNMALIDMAGNIVKEVHGAIGKFPRNEHMTAALVEEVGELSNALLEHHRGNQPAQNVYTEAVQVAAMAIRLALESSAEFQKYDYDVEFAEDFRPTGTPKRLHPELSLDSSSFDRGIAAFLKGIGSSREPAA
jgi:hypothetical protein